MDGQRIGAGCAAVLATVSAAIGVVRLLALRPMGQTVDAGPGLLVSLADNGSGWWLLNRWLLLASAVVALGLVAALHRLAPAEHRTLADWTAAVGLMGFVTLALHQVRLISHTPGLAAAVAAAGESEAPRRLVNLSFINLVDRYGIILDGAVGVWLMVTAVVLLPGSPPRGLRLLAALAATTFLALPMSAGPWAVLVASVAALTILPGVLVWLAVHLHRLPADSRG